MTAVSDTLKLIQVSWALNTVGDRRTDIQIAMEEILRILREYYSHHQNRLIDPLIAQLDVSSLNSYQSFDEIDAFLYEGKMYTSSFLTIFQETLQHLHCLEPMPNNLVIELIKLKQIIFPKLTVEINRIINIKVALGQVQQLLIEYYLQPKPITDAQSGHIKLLVERLAYSSLENCNSQNENALLSNVKLLIDKLAIPGLENCNSRAEIDAFLASFSNTFQEILQQIHSLPPLPSKFIPSHLMIELIKLKQTIFEQIPASEPTLAAKSIRAKL